MLLMHWADSNHQYMFNHQCMFITLKFSKVITCFSIHMVLTNAYVVWIFWIVDIAPVQQQCNTTQAVVEVIVKIKVPVTHFFLRRGAY